MRVSLIAALALTLLLIGCGQEGSAPSSPTSPSAPGPDPAGSEAPAGFFIEGRVVDPWSDPIEGAEVTARRGEASAAASSDPEGRFRLEVEGPGPWSVEARHPQRGMDRRPTDTLREGEVYRLPDLRIAGHGRLEGRLLDPAGEPLASTAIVAYSRSLLQQECLGGSELLELDALPLRAPELESGYPVPGEGFRRVATTTRKDGTFVLSGLAREPFLLDSPAFGERPWWSPDRTWIAPSREDLELTSGLCQVTLAVAEQGGAEADGTPRRIGPLEVFPAVPSSHGPRPMRGVPVYADDERNIFQVEPGDYIARVTTYPPIGRFGATLHVEERFTIEPGVARKTVELALPEDGGPTGRLRVSVTVPEGWETPERFHLLSGLTAKELEVSEFTPFPELRYDEWLEVPVGSYHVALDPFTDFVGRPEVAELAPCQRPVTVRPGEEVEVELVAAPGGRMRVELGADRLVFGEDLVLPEGLPSGDAALLKGNLELTMGLVIAGEREGGGPLLPLRLRDVGGVSVPERARVLPGESITHFELLEPGVWTLWAWSPAFELDAVQVTVRAGETTPVRLDLRARP